MIYARRALPGQVVVGGLRRAVREILLCCFLAACYYAFSLPPDSANAAHPLGPSLLFGTMAGPVVWIPYRIIRFALGR